VSHAELVLLGRVVLGFALTFVIGFERGLRGSPAGDRTFGLVGVSATAVTAVASHSSPQAIAGVVTGIGFIGAGVVFRGNVGNGELVHGLTTAATIFSAAAIGVVVGYGQLWLGVITAALILVTLELRFIPVLKYFDAATHAAHDHVQREGGRTLQAPEGVLPAAGDGADVPGA
jgi:putative Mg2+ transporter-C (MgtC) family protein